MSTVAENEAARTVSFHAALSQAEVLARQFLDPVLHERLSSAVALVRGGQVFQDADHAWLVASTTKPDHEYRINGHGCQCEDALYRTQGRCKHQLAVFLARKSLQLMHQPPAPVIPEVAEPWPGEGGEAPTSTRAPLSPAAADSQVSQGIDPRHIVLIRQKPFVRYSGLLQMAYAQGLIRLETTFISVTADLALAQCTATFAGGRVVTDVADSTPGNVGATVKLHWARLAATRAAARALRNALAIDMCALEELGDD